MSAGPFELKRPIGIDEVGRIAERATGRTPGVVTELQPKKSVRTFHVGDVVVRVDEDPAGDALAVEHLVLDTLRTATVPPLGPEPLALVPPDDAGRTALVYRLVEGHTLDAAGARGRARDLGVAFAHLHGARVMDLGARLGRARPLTLMESYRACVEDVKGWLAARELDGLSQDLLTLALFDLQRALRPFCIAQDHSFLLSRRRVLCHGRPAPELCVVRNESSLMSPIALVGFEDALLGDAAEDLATFAITAGLDEHAEEVMLASYLNTLDDLERSDARFVQRYFARRALLLFSLPVARLARMARVKRGEEVTLRDPVVEIEEEARLTYDELARAMNGLRDLGGRARPVGPAQVAAMGRLVAIEEMILADRVFRIAVTGRPYVGKTEVASQLARRLKHRFVPTVAYSRALALIEADLLAAGESAPEAHKLPALLFARGVDVRPQADPPYYRMRIGADDVTERLHAGGALAVRAATLLDDERVRAALKDALTKAAPAEGVVIEGPSAPALLSGRVQVFHLDADAGVRRARLSAHRPDLETDEAASELLARLDEGMGPAPRDAVPVDVGSKTASAATLELLWHLLPPGRRPQEDLSGRAVL